MEGANAGEHEVVEDAGVDDTWSDEAVGVEEVGGTDDVATPGEGGGSRNRKEMLRVSGRRLAVLYGLAGVAIAQPVLDLFGKSPEFFVAGRHTGRHVAWFILLVAVVPALTLGAVVTVAAFIHRRAGAVLMAATVAGLSFLFGLVLADALGLDGPAGSLAVAAVVAGVLTWLQSRSAGARVFLSWLAVGNLVFVGLFVSGESGELISDRPVSDVSDLAWAEGELDGPVVVLVVDELPLATLVTSEGEINADRYPHIARFADRSTWYRNASSHTPMTHMAMPIMLSGTMPRSGALPTYEDYPENLFTLFGEDEPVRGYESVTHLCPDALCGARSQGALRTMVKDVGIVFGHQVLPDGLRDRLPAIGHAWGNFGGASEGAGNGDGVGSAGPDESDASEESAGGAAEGGADGGPEGADELITDGDPYGRWHALDPADMSARTQIRFLQETVDTVDAGSGIHLAHVAAPHYPWVLTPDGELTQTLHLERDPPDPDHVLQAEQAFQLQSLQIGAVDRVIGDLTDRLDDQGVWDDALVVLVSDHGRSMDPPPDFGRDPTDDNLEELLRVPLMIKAPGQEEGQVVDEPAKLVDLLPTLVDLLDLDVGDVAFDGRSLMDDSSERAPEAGPRVDPGLDPLLDLAERNEERFPHGDGWTGLAGLGEHGDLVGTPVDDHDVADDSAMTIELDDEVAFGDLPVNGNQWPQLLVGTVQGVGGDRPPDLVASVNGTVAGVLTGYEDLGGAAWIMTGVTAPLWEAGANEVVVYEVERPGGSGGSAVLHPVPSP